MSEVQEKLVLASNAINYLATDQRQDEYELAFERAKEKTHCLHSESTKQLTLFQQNSNNMEQKDETRIN